MSDRRRGEKRGREENWEYRNGVRGKEAKKRKKRGRRRDNKGPLACCDLFPLSPFLPSRTVERGEMRVRGKENRGSV